MINMNKIVVTKLVVLFSCALLVASCGNGGNVKPAGQTDSANSSTTTAAAPTPATGVPGEKALELIGSSDCTTCHRLHKAAEGAVIGPPYDQVAAKYSPAPDTTVDRLV